MEEKHFYAIADLAKYEASISEECLCQLQSKWTMSTSKQCQRPVNVTFTASIFLPPLCVCLWGAQKYFHSYIVSGCEQKWEDLVSDVKVNATITTDTRSKQLSVQLHNSPSLTHSRYTWKFLYFQRSPSPNFTISTKFHNLNQISRLQDSLVPSLSVKFPRGVVW